MNIHSEFKKLEKNTSNNISWNSSIENNVQEIEEKSKGYKIMHLQQARKMNRVYGRLMFTGIALGPLAGLISAIKVMIKPMGNEYQDIAFSISVIFISFLSGISVAITKYGRYEEKGSHHKVAASKYKGLESNVKRQLVLSREDRINAVKYLDYVGGKFDDLFTSSPLISRSIYNNYVEVANTSGISIPDEYGLNLKTYKRFSSPSLIKNTINLDLEKKIRSKSSFDLNQIVDKKSSCELEKNEKQTNDVIFDFERKNRIEIYIDENSKPLIEIDTNSPLESFKKSSSPNSKKLSKSKKEKTLLHLAELNQFSDGRMEYEIERMKGT
jgi:hypothetical protein